MAMLLFTDGGLLALITIPRLEWELETIKKFAAKQRQTLSHNQKNQCLP